MLLGLFGQANAGVNYLLINLIPNGSNTLISAQLSIAATCPVGYSIHTYGMYDGVGIKSWTEAFGGSYWIRTFEYGNTAYCIAGVPNQITVTPPLRPNAFCSAATIATSISAGGSAINLNGCTYSSHSGVGILLPDGFAVAGYGGSNSFGYGSMKDGATGYIADINSIPSFGISIAGGDLAIGKVVYQGYISTYSSGIPFCISGGCASHTYVIGY